MKEIIETERDFHASLILDMQGQFYLVGFSAPEVRRTQGNKFVDQVIAGQRSLALDIGISAERFDEIIRCGEEDYQSINK